MLRMTSPYIMSGKIVILDPNWDGGLHLAEKSALVDSSIFCIKLAAFSLYI